MLSPELVRVRKRGQKLSLAEFSSEARASAERIAAEVLSVFAEHAGSARSELDEALLGVPCDAKERKLLLGLCKLAADDSEFSGADGTEAARLRRAVFERAADVRRGLGAGERFAREPVLALVAQAESIAPDELDARLYADLRGAERLLSPCARNAQSLVARYEEAQVQAILLCSTRVVVEVRCARADAYRALFQKLKFRRLLFRLERLENGGYRIEIDGPFSLFESVTKYGMELALLLPALAACDQVKLAAELRWGKRRERLEFQTELGGGRAEPLALRDDVAAVLEAFETDGGGWRAEPASEILELPGIGLSVPDLSFTHQKTKQRILCELLGFWSREAVWKRVELVEQGLAERVLFVASSRLRVSEEVLEDDASSALYVYKGRINPKALARKLDELCARTAAPAKKRQRAAK
jgi:predicted nuclease of restriction endonuclease-like RecB superfamily